MAFQRLEESGKPWRDAKLNKRKSKRVFELENQLSSHNSRTSSLAKFQAYLATRFKVQQELYQHYCYKSHRIARWHNWRDRRKSEDKFVQKVLNTFRPAAATATATATATACHCDCDRSTESHCCVWQWIWVSCITSLASLTNHWIA